MNTDYSIILNFTAGVFLAIAQTAYILQVIKKNITPSLYTWLGWTLLVGLSLFSQVADYGWNWTLLGHLFSSLGCALIFLLILLFKNYEIRSNDWIYLLFGLGCLLIYFLFSDPWMTTLFAILADAVLGVPTILKAIRDPKSEKSIGWNVALVCWSLTLLTCLNGNVIFILFPLYCLLFNGGMSFLTTKRRVQSIS